MLGVSEQRGVEPYLCPENSRFADHGASSISGHEPATSRELSKLSDLGRETCLLGLHPCLGRIDCDALGIHQIPLVCVRGCGAERASDCTLAGIDVLEELRAYGSDFKRLWHVGIHVHDRFFSERTRLRHLLACFHGVGRSGTPATTDPTRSSDRATPADSPTSPESRTLRFIPKAFARFVP